MHRSVLITGVAGFIGSNLAAECARLGWRVTGVDDLSSGDQRFLPGGVEFVRADFSDGQVLREVEGGAYDTVFHLAAQPRVSHSVERPFDTNETNVSKSLRLMEACRGRVGRLVFASSSAVYGDSPTLPAQESSMKDPQSPYGLQKLVVEDYLRLFWRLYRLDSACLRFFNVFGPNQRGGSPYSTAVSAWLHAIHSGVSMRSDGEGDQSRDMVHVDNVVSALVLAAEHRGPLMGEAFNVGTGHRVTNNEILEYLLAVFPWAQSHSAPRRPGDVMHTQADIRRSASVLGYRVVKEFWPGLDDTIRWAADNRELFLGTRL